MNKTPMIMLLLGVAFLSACIVQNAAPATDSVAPAAPDQGFVANSANTVVRSNSCEANPDDFILLGQQGDHAVGIKSYELSTTSGVRGTLDSMNFYAKSTDPSWTKYTIEVSARPLGTDQMPFYFSEKVELRSGFSGECINFDVDMGKSITDVTRNSILTVRLVKAGRSLAVAQGEFAFEDNA